MPAQDDSNRDESISADGHGFDEAPAEAIVFTVSEKTGQSPLEMEPLSEVIDPDALNALVGGQTDRHSSMTVTFDYCGQQVVVAADDIQVTASTSTD